MADPFSDFVARPDAETFHELRAAIMATAEFDMFSDGLGRLQALVDAGAHQQVLALVSGLMPNWLLNRRVHRLLQQSAAARGEAERAAREGRIAMACALGLRSTGAGTSDAPFWPVHADDEYDLAKLLEKTVTGQRREDRNGRTMDVLTCADGSELWFDVTDGIVAMAKRAAAEI